MNIQIFACHRKRIHIKCHIGRFFSFLSFRQLAFVQRCYSLYQFSDNFGWDGFVPFCDSLCCYCVRLERPISGVRSLRACFHLAFVTLFFNYSILFLRFHYVVNLLLHATKDAKIKHWDSNGKTGKRKTTGRGFGSGFFHGFFGFTCFRYRGRCGLFLAMFSINLK